MKCTAAKVAVFFSILLELTTLLKERRITMMILRRTLNINNHNNGAANTGGVVAEHTPRGLVDYHVLNCTSNMIFYQVVGVWKRTVKPHCCGANISKVNQSTTNSDNSALHAKGIWKVPCGENNSFHWRFLCTVSVHEPCTFSHVFIGQIYALQWPSNSPRKRADPPPLIKNVP